MTRKVEFTRVNPEDALSGYKNRITGSRSVWGLLKYEILTSLLGKIPNAAGILLRQKFYRFILGTIEENVVINASVTIRNPQKVFLKKGVMIDEYACLDVGSHEAKGIVCGDYAIVERMCHISAGYTGYVEIGMNSVVGAGTQIWGEGDAVIGKNVLIAGGSFLITVNHDIHDANKNIMEQGSLLSPVTIEDNTWMGANVTVLPGVVIGQGSVIGAGSVVTKSIPPSSIAYGAPARVVKKR